MCRPCGIGIAGRPGRARRAGGFKRAPACRPRRLSEPCGPGAPESSRRRVSAARAAVTVLGAVPAPRPQAQPQDLHRMGPGPASMLVGPSGRSASQNTIIHAKGDTARPRPHVRRRPPRAGPGRGPRSEQVHDRAVRPEILGVPVHVRCGPHHHPRPRRRLGCQRRRRRLLGRGPAGGRPARRWLWRRLDRRGRRTRAGQEPGDGLGDGLEAGPETVLPRRLRRRGRRARGRWRARRRTPAADIDDEDSRVFFCLRAIRWLLIVEGRSAECLAVCLGRMDPNPRWRAGSNIAVLDRHDADTFAGSNRCRFFLGASQSSE